ncbi:FecR family protein [Bradyrhizobium sediminis]|uniref:FecR family protein n=1 Tax=Bradyrhizobium sediminis TaxID=2840469 RepID=A0A975NMK6_9BRAD|nr:FecR family protein [Bradyrhizobium sediminis]QWG17271.1 FecR family protein [Bradyrhizobium sediminis]
MCTHTIAVLVASLVLAVAGVFPAQAQREFAAPAVRDITLKPIGRIVAATGAVTIEPTSARVIQASTVSQAGQAKAGDLVYLGDVVATGADGRVGINFTDGSSFNLSNSARMALDEFVYDPNGKSNSTLLSLTKGTITFVAGKIATTGDMKIDTPVATVGVRGTTPHVEIQDDGTVKFSTLIEEGKSKLTKKPGTPAAAQQPEQKPHPKSNLNICRGC